MVNGEVARYRRKRRIIPTDEATDSLLLTVSRYSEDRDRHITRVRFSDRAFSKLVGRRNYYDDQFLTELRASLLECGWVLAISSSSFALIREDTIDRLNLVSTKRVSDMLEVRHTEGFDMRVYRDEIEEVVDFDGDEREP